MPSHCRFDLDHPNGVYYSGQTVNGIITLTTTKEKNVRHVRIVFLGEAKVKWTENSMSDPSISTATYYKSHEVYVHSETQVRGEGNLPPGLHTYTFSISLPVQCPTSCEGKFGHIRYGLSLILERPFRYNNVFHMPLTVLQTSDLNLNPTFKLPLLAERVDSLCHWNCSSGKIIYALRIPFGAYSPGQMVKYSVCIRNQSMAHTVGYSLEFTQKMTFTANKPRSREQHKRKVLVQQGTSEACFPLTSRIFEGQFRIPAVAPTTVNPCIIQVEYNLKVSLYMSGCHRSKNLSIPLVIGTIPVAESLRLRPVSAAPPVDPSASALEPPDKSFNSDMPPSNQYLEPPSYEAAMQSGSAFVDDDIDKRLRVVGFRPLYPMYS